MFWCGVSLAGICLYLTPGLNCVVDGWQVTLRTKFAPTLGGSMASCPLPRRRCGKRWDAGCVSISAEHIEHEIYMILEFDSFQSNCHPLFAVCCVVFQTSNFFPSFSRRLSDDNNAAQQHTPSVPLPLSYNIFQVRKRLNWIQFTSIEPEPMSHRSNRSNVSWQDTLHPFSCCRVCVHLTRPQLE